MTGSTHWHKMMDASTRTEFFRLINRPIADLSDNEKVVLAFCELAARRKRALEPNDDIAHAMGCVGSGTVSGLLRALEKKGYIETISYQRGRQVYVHAVGQWTLPPPNQTIHWRKDPNRVAPAVPVHKVQQKSETDAMWIDRECRRINAPRDEFLCELVLIGAEEYRRRQQQAAA